MLTKQRRNMDAHNLISNTDKLGNKVVNRQRTANFQTNQFKHLLNTQREILPIETRRLSL